jgi:hypothetical protein
MQLPHLWQQSNCSISNCVWRSSPPHCKAFPAAGRCNSTWPWNVTDLVGGGRCRCPWHCTCLPEGKVLSHTALRWVVRCSGLIRAVCLNRRPGPFSTRRQRLYGQTAGQYSGMRSAVNCRAIRNICVPICATEQSGRCRLAAACYRYGYWWRALLHKQKGALSGDHILGSVRPSVRPYVTRYQWLKRVPDFREI